MLPHRAVPTNPRQEVVIPSVENHRSVAPPIRLARVVVENFRSLARVDLDLEPSITTLIGENDCGKSVLLDAIGLLLDPRQPDSQDSRPAIGAEDLIDDDAARITLVFEVNAGAIPDGRSWGVLKRTCSVLNSPQGTHTLAVRVSAERPAAKGDAPELSCQVLSAPDKPVHVDDPWLVLAAARAVSPALRVRVMRPSADAPTAPRGDASKHSSRSRLLEIYRQMSAGGPGSGGVPADAVRQAIADATALVEVSAWTRDRAAPMQRALRELISVPQVLSTTLASAAEAAPESSAADRWPDVRLFTMMLLTGALLDAAESITLEDGAAPILLVDDLGDQLHPTWLASIGSMITNLPAQLVVTTHSAELLARVALTSVRRLVRRGRQIDVFAVGRRLRSLEDQRRVSYHIRLRSPGSLLARCWLLVEGETEAWIIPELARIMGVEFPVEGVRCVEFDQAGVAPMVKIADDLGIAWRLLSDGDQAGQHYALAAENWSGSAESRGGVARLNAPDIEHYLFRNGFESVYRRVARIARSPGSRSDARLVIRTAVKKTSKPAMALAVLEHANQRGPSSVPLELARLIGELAALARGGR